MSVRGRSGFPAEVRAEAVAAYVAGESMPLIAASVGCTVDSVRNWVRAAGVPRRRRGRPRTRDVDHGAAERGMRRRRVAAERRQEAVRLRSEGASYREIGDALGVSHQWAFELVRRARADGAEHR